MNKIQTHSVSNENELIQFQRLLQKNKLPHQDITLRDSSLVTYHEAEGEIIGTGGLEFYSNYALLRSISVDESCRGKSIGKYIVSDLLQRSRHASVTEVYLLTETAHDFFIKLGFKDIRRENVPAEIKSSSEFSSVCPVSAACMIYRMV